MVFSRDALLLVGHGSSRYADAGRWLHEHTAALRSAGHFAETAVGLLRGSPSIADALAALTARVVRIVPFFMEDGYFTRSTVPAALAQGRHRDGEMLRYCPPVGLHPGLAKIIAARVEHVCPDPSSWSVVLVGHGSSREPGRSPALHRHRASLVASGRFAHVGAAFLEEPPFVPDVLAELRCRKTVVVGFFAGHGGHPRDDLPDLIEAEQAHRAAGGLPLLAVGPISADPAMRAIILDQAATGEWLKPNSR
jgi:sirohydrochlorin cobaltochelatase